MIPAVSKAPLKIQEIDGSPVGFPRVLKVTNGTLTDNGDGSFTLTIGAGGVSDGDKGDITVSGSGATWTIDAGVVTYAKMQDISATSRVLGRKTSGAGDTEECTLSEVLDFIGSAAQGDILYRDSAAWARLGAGTSGHFLKTQGAAANPVWAAAAGDWVPLATATASSSASIDFTGLTSAYIAYMVVLANVAPATDGVELWLRTSTDGGSSYDAGASDYDWINAIVAGGVAAGNDTADNEIRLLDAQGNAANETCGGHILIHNPGAAAYCHATFHLSFTSTAGASRLSMGQGRRLSAGNVDAIRLMYSSGNIAAGEFRLYGMKAAA